MREPGDTRPRIPDYTTVDLTLRREKLARNWDVRAMVVNLFNRNAKEPTFMEAFMPSDLPLPGRAFYIQFQYDFERMSKKYEPTKFAANPLVNNPM